jgi:hypothetical protein
MLGHRLLGKSVLLGCGFPDFQHLLGRRLPHMDHRHLNRLRWLDLLPYIHVWIYHDRSRREYGR